MKLFGGGESDSIVTKIENSVVWADEDITQDPQRTTWCWNIDTKETADAFSLSHGGNLESKRGGKFKSSIVICGIFKYSPLLLSRGGKFKSSIVICGIFKYSLLLLIDHLYFSSADHFSRCFMS